MFYKVDSMGEKLFFLARMKLAMEHLQPQLEAD